MFIRHRRISIVTHPLRCPGLTFQTIYPTGSELYILNLLLLMLFIIFILLFHNKLMICQINAFEHSLRFSKQEEKYFCLFVCLNVIEEMRVLPRKWFSKRTEVSLIVKTLVQAIKAASKKNLIQTFNILLALFFTLFIQYLPLVFKSDRLFFPKILEYPMRQNHYCRIILFLLNINIVLNRLMHIPKHL